MTLLLGFQIKHGINIPHTTEKFVSWLNAFDPREETINLIYGLRNFRRNINERNWNF
jgi:hypothetical protein